MEMQFATIWEAISDHIPNDPALICGEDIVTWKEYEERAAKLAFFLNEQSIGNNSKVGLYLSLIHI